MNSMTELGKAWKVREGKKKGQEQICHSKEGGSIQAWEVRGEGKERKGWEIHTEL